MNKITFEIKKENNMDNEIIIYSNGNKIISKQKLLNTYQFNFPVLNNDLYYDFSELYFEFNHNNLIEEENQLIDYKNIINAIEINNNLTSNFIRISDITGIEKIDKIYYNLFSNWCSSKIQKESDISLILYSKYKLKGNFTLVTRTTKNKIEYPVGINLANYGNIYKKKLSKCFKISKNLLQTLSFTLNIVLISYNLYVIYIL
jgi:hypothetical protein